MIKANKIYNELSIYTENKIILWGGGFFGREYLEKLRWFEINVVAFCDNNSSIHGSEIEGVPVISPDELRKMLEENDDIVVQIACETDEEVLVRQLQNLGVVNYISKKDMEHNVKYFKKYSDIDFDVKFTGNSDGNHIRLTKIDSEFSIYKNNKVILWGAGKLGRQILDLFIYHKLEVTAFCDTNEELHGTEVNGVTVISPDKLKGMVDDGENIVVQIAGSPDEHNKSCEIIENMSITQWISCKECLNILIYIKRCDYVTYNHQTAHTSSWMQDTEMNKLINIKNYLAYECNEVANIVCMVGKTGDTTLRNTFNKHYVHFCNTGHSTDVVNKNIFSNGVCKKIKVTTAVREPITIYLSGIYENLSNIGTLINSVNMFNDILFPYEYSTFLKNGGDIQYFFDKRVSLLERGIGHLGIENFINKFCDEVVDIKKVPFDKDKGYTIVKDGNIEVFVYQLEKMNDIVKELAEFVGGDFTEWEIGNVASDKWIADSYKQAQREIKFSQEYFDKCFNESYVSHFYSEEDIKKFKSRWRPHIRENS